MEPLLAGLFAGALAFAELKQALQRQRVPIGAMHWVVARMGIDGILAAAAYPLMLSTTGVTSWPATLLPVLLSGFAAPAVLRSNVVIGREAKRFGIGVRYQRWLTVVADEIADISSDAQSKWLWNRVVPKISVYELEALRNRSVTYLHARRQARQLTDKQVKTYEEYIERIIKDPEADDDAKRATLMQTLVDLGGRRFVGGLAKSAKHEQRRLKSGSTPLRELGHDEPTDGD
jgi:hypothetical protein